MPPLTHGGSEEAAGALGRVAPLASRWIERLLAAHEPPLTVGQFLALEAVAEGEVIGSELARRAAVSPAAISQLVAGLEQSGLVGRLRAPADRRRQQLALTADGRAVLDSARASIREQLAPLLSGLAPGEADALARSLLRLEELLGGKAPPPRPHRPPPHDGSPHGIGPRSRSSP